MGEPNDGRRRRQGAPPAAAAAERAFRRRRTTRPVRGGRQVLFRVPAPPRRRPSLRRRSFRRASGDAGRPHEGVRQSGQPEEALRLLRQTREAPPPSTFRRRRWAVLCYNTALNAVVEKGGGPLEVAAVLDQMQSAGLAMDASTHNILLKVSPSSRSFARRVFDSMSSSGCRPDETTYSTLIARLSRAGRIDEAYRVLDQMLREASALMKVMEKSGCPPSTVAHNILIGGFCRRRDFSAVETMLAECAVAGWRPSVVSYNTFMDGLCKAGRAEEAFKQLGAMAANGLCPSAVTINILLCCLCRDSNPHEAKRLLEASSQLGWEVTAVNYNTVMSAFCEIREWAAVVELLVAMVKKGVVPDARTCNILRKARRIMENGGFTPNAVTYNTLIDGFLAVGAAADADELLRRMLEENIEHDLVTYTIRIEHLCRERRSADARHLFGDLKRHLSADLVVYSALIGGLVRNGDLSAGRMLLKEMLNQGLSPDVPTFDKLIRAHCISGLCRTGDICNVVGEMLEKIRLQLA
ncbi:unnamed protein product [Spirodela intermedia]|uniref:Uncharacterized protein n=1 Tax=Spirodela intermedia TaxID=51605 RepID=A0A7I8IZI9_SPIIN|nr:unnamed protein product [Spirodela intermedia]CAA6662571.1 unnamed protein product [Spirodela intermedia]